MRRRRTACILSAAIAAALLSAAAARAADVSSPAILQIYEAKHATIERRAPDIFMAGYGHIWTPPPGRAEQGNLSVGYDPYDRFDLGSAGNETLYGTETGLKTAIKELHKFGLNVYTDMVWNHNGPANQGLPGFAQAGGYPGFVLSQPGDADGDFHGAFEGGDHNGRLAGLIDIAQEKNYQFIRSPVPGFANNIPAGTTPAYGRLANVPSESNRRFYADRDLAPIVVHDPTTGEQNIAIYPFNKDNPMAGDPVEENALGYLMRHTRWMVEEIGVDGFRLDATKHMPAWVLNYYDRAVYRAHPTSLLDGSTKHVFAFGEFLDANAALVQPTIRKDINPNDPGRIGGNRDALDFALHYALRDNLTGNGAANNWHKIIGTSQDKQDDGFANNGSQGVAFDASHDEGGAHLGNVANAYLLMRPGNAVVYINAKEFGDGRDFPRNGRGDALGGFYGDTITKLIDIRNTHGRGNFQERWLDDAFNPNGFSNVFVYEREKSAVVALNSRLDGGFDERTPVQTSFAPGTHLVELTGNASDPTVDPFGDIPDTVTVNGAGQITVRIPRNKNANGVEHGKGYVIYGLQNPKGNVAVSNVAKTLAGATPTAANNGTARLTSVDVIKANSFDFSLNTTAVTLSDGFRDFDADGDNALLKVDGGLNVNGNAGVDFTSGEVVYGFEQFVTQRSPGTQSASGNGTYVQTIDTTQLSEGYHYLTARAFRRRTDGGPAIFSDFRKVIYVDRLRPVSAVAELKPFAGPDDVDVIVRSTDQTATGVHVFHNLGASQFTDQQLVSMAAGGSNPAGTYDRDLFKYGIVDLKDGNHAFTVVTFEATFDSALGYAGGGVNVQRIAGVPFANGGGVGLADLNFNNSYDLADVSAFASVLASNNTSYNPAADLNADGLVDETDNVLNVPWLVSKSASAGVINNATQLRLTRAMALDGTLHVPAGSLDVSGTNVPAAPLTFNNSFNIAANETITKTGGQALNVNAPQTHGVNATLVVAEGEANINTNGGTNLTVNAAGGAVSFGLTQNLKSVGVGPGSTVTITPALPSSAGKTLKVASLNMTGGKLDIRNNSVIVDWAGADPYPSLVNAILEGKNGFTWDGPTGISSSDVAAVAEQGLHAVGIASAGAIFGLGETDTLLWGGQQIDGTTWLIKYTYAGDANLDGLVDGADYGLIDNYVQFPGTDGYWNGDFNYDGIIDGADYGLIDNSVQLQGDPIFPWWASASGSSSELSVSAVPEPSACGFALLAAGAALGRRSRNRNRNENRTDSHLSGAL